MKLLYFIFIHVYPIIVRIASLKNEKAKLWIKGRKNIFDQLEKTNIQKSDFVVWIHCASLGEFEQGRPIIEAIKKQHNHVKIVLTFFSPSGYEVRKNYKYADWVFYLPMDSPQNAQRFFAIIQPKIIFFVKYEFWNFYLQEAKKQAVETILISGIFRETQPFFKWYGFFHRNMLRCFTQLFVQNNQSKKLLEKIGFNQQVIIHGDTRFDRVIATAAEFSSIEPIEKWIQKNKTVIVAGSTWYEDDVLLASLAKKHSHIQLIIAPHSIENNRIKECKELYNRPNLYSQIQDTNNNHQASNVLVIDNVGMLSRLYKYANICYVGGGFTKDGIHNILEAAVYGKPIIIGSNYQKYAEAIDLVKLQAVYPIKNALELEHLVNKLLNDIHLYKQASTESFNYVHQHKGATKLVEEYLYEKRLFTKL
ncbi:MAG: 3-deoxy-D-manno-octulosonic acid transferase [Chitinophagaceae bacterium]